MKICVLTDRYPTHNARGGAAMVAHRLAKSYEESGHEVVVITTKQTEDVAVNDESYRIEAIHTEGFDRTRPARGIYNHSTVGVIESLLEQIQPDVVHAHNVHEFLSYYSLKLVKRRSIPLVLTFHDAMSVSYGKIKHFPTESHDPTERIESSALRVGFLRRLRQSRTQYLPFRTRLNRWYLNRYVDCGVSVSQILRRALRTNGVDCETVIHNGVDTKRFRTGDQHRFREQFGLGDSRIILHGGRVGYLKGSHHLGEVFGKLAADFDDIKLVITGAEDCKWVRDKVAPFEDRLVETGWISEELLLEAYRAATVVVSPSLYLDPFPTVNIEALASGTPVVTSCFGGGPEAVKHGETGIVTNPLDIDRFYDDMRQLLADTDRVATMGKNAAEDADSRFSLTRQSNEYLGIFDSLL
jgi:glycosyltransferase involved in cell wall biosynthesis